MQKIKALIVDDIELAIASMDADIRDNFSEDIEIVGTASGVMDAAKQFIKLKPDLIFLDIHMGDGDGFDLLEMIERDHTDIIFTTASKDFAIDAFKVNAVDYLLKPIDLDLLSKAIDKLKIKRQGQAIINTDEGRVLSLSTQEELRRVKQSNIIRLESSGNYTFFYLTDGSKVLVTKTMKIFEKQLDQKFVRVHQSHIVNLDHIRAYVKSEGGYIEMRDDSIVPVSVRKKPMVKALLS